jgi:hypothetical protein
MKPKIFKNVGDYRVLKVNHTYHRYEPYGRFKSKTDALAVYNSQKTKVNHPHDMVLLQQLREEEIAGTKNLHWVAMLVKDES